MATMGWVCHITRFLIPKVISYQSSQDNPIGFEWVLMTQMPGNPLSKIWHSVPFAAKSCLVREYAMNAAYLYRNKLRGIRNVYEAPSVVGDSTSSEDNLPAQESDEIEISTSAKAQGSGDMFGLSGSGPLQESLPDVGRIVSMPLFWGSRLSQDISRGPLRSSQDWNHRSPHDWTEWLSINFG